MDPAVKGPAVMHASVFQKATIVVCVAVVLTGCSLFGGGQKGPASSGPSATSGASGPSAASTTSTVDPISPDIANSLIVPKNDVAELVGSTLDYEGKASNPSSATVDGKESCRALMVPLTTDIGDKWTTYRNVWYQETKDSFSHLITQRVLLYPSRDDATATYAKEFAADSRTCSGEDLKIDTATWRASVRDASEDHTRWVLDEIVDGNPSGWRCMAEARAIDNVLFMAMICQRGNAAPAVKAIVDRMAAGATKSK